MYFLYNWRDLKILLLLLVFFEKNYYYIPAFIVQKNRFRINLE